MPYDLARDYLESQLRPNLLDERSRRWLSALHTSESGQHLGTNLAIDLKSGALSTITVAKLVQAATAGGPAVLNGDRACEAFAGVLVSSICSHAAGACPAGGDDQYAHVLKLSAALRYYFQGAMALDFNMAGLETVENEFSKPAPFEILAGRRLQGGGIGIVWITTAKALRDVAIANPANPALAVRLGLGLGGLHIWSPLDPGKIVVLHYPPSFSSPTYQPTVCDSSCLPGSRAFPYLSAKTGDRWGLTWSVDGSPTRLPERVHKPVDDFPWPEAGGELLDGAPAPGPVELDYAKLLDEGEARLRAIPGGLEK